MGDLQAESKQKTNKSIPRLNKVVQEKILVKESDVFDGERSCWLLLPPSWDVEQVASHGMHQIGNIQG